MTVIKHTVLALLLPYFIIIADVPNTEAGQVSPVVQNNRQHVKNKSPSAFAAYANGCSPPVAASWPSSAPGIPALPAGAQPNFIVVLADDMGYDDIGLHHPRGPDGVTSAGAQTPNIDKLIKHGMSFSNFYATPLCAMGRAELLTGRDYPRTGNLFNSRGYEAFSLNEATAGDVMQQAGYITAHYGKWHNGRALGYEPWWRGFNESWLPTDYIHMDNLMRHNGKYVQTSGMMEHVLMDKMLDFLMKREQDGKPFFLYYAPYAIHKNVQKTGLAQNRSTLYFAPEPYLTKIKAIRPTPGGLNAQVWAMLLYFDDVLGRLFEYIQNSPLHNNTYIMLTADNGPGLPRAFLKDQVQKLMRMPSGMLGDKNTIEPTLGSTGTEGALRNHLTVYGPGIPSGKVDDTLLSLTDVLPTLAELAQAHNTHHMPWSGLSFANLLQLGPSATKQQHDRFLFTLVVSGDERQCPVLEELMTKSLARLSKDRMVQKPQPRLTYVNSTGGSVLKSCIVGRYKQYKWYGSTNRVFRFTNGSHIELPCNEVTGREQRQLAAIFDQHAKQWWDSVLAEPNSFAKPVFQIGLKGWKASNVEAAGAIEMSRGNVTLLSFANFSGVGHICWDVNVITPGWYTVATMYRFFSRSGSGMHGMHADFELSVGSSTDIKAGDAASVTGLMRALPGKRSHLGNLFLGRTVQGHTEVCFKLNGFRNMTSSMDENQTLVTAQDADWFFHLFNIRFVLQPEGPNAASSTKKATAVPYGLYQANITLLEATKPAQYHHLQATSDMLQFEQHMRQGSRVAKLQQESAAAVGNITARQERLWRMLQQRHSWPDGQVVFESLYRPCEHLQPGQCMEMCED